MVYHSLLGKDIMIGLFRRAASWKPTSPALKTLVSHGAATGDSDCVPPPRRGILKLCEMARVRASEPVGEKKIYSTTALPIKNRTSDSELTEPTVRSAA